MPVYRGLDDCGVPFIVGPGNANPGAAPASDGLPGDGPARRGKLGYRPGAKVEWIMQTLPTITSEYVFLLDTDTVWLCCADEVLRKRAMLLSNASAREDSVLIFGEKSMWPPHQEYRGTHLRLNATAGYPPVERDRPFRYINAGAALGRPKDLIALHRCMQERYTGYPHACPAGHGRDGGLRYYAANNSWQPPELGRPLHSRDVKYHGLRLKGGNWGWEQGCYHMYYLEHINGELPAHCPPIVIDRRAACMLHLANVHPARLGWTSTDLGENERPRVTLKDTAERPCVLHANGPAKTRLKPIWRWWEASMNSTLRYSTVK